jgi:hypothetical protein
VIALVSHSSLRSAEYAKNTKKSRGDSGKFTVKAKTGHVGNSVSGAGGDLPANAPETAAGLDRSTHPGVASPGSISVGTSHSH